MRSLLNWLIHLLGGKTAAHYAAQEKALRHHQRLQTRLQLHRWHKQLSAEQWARASTVACRMEKQRVGAELEKLRIVTSAPYHRPNDGYICVNIGPLAGWLLKGNKGAKKLLEDALCALVVHEFNRTFADAVPC
jgi:hypothetical protein